MKYFERSYPRIHRLLLQVLGFVFEDPRSIVPQILLYEEQEKKPLSAPMTMGIERKTRNTL